MSITIHLKTEFPVDRRNLYIKVDTRSFGFEYLETKFSGQREICELYRIPTLELFGQVDPGQTEVKIQDTYVRVKLSFKLTRCTENRTRDGWVRSAYASSVPSCPAMKISVLDGNRHG